jgi:hypothetical protein
MPAAHARRSSFALFVADVRATQVRALDTLLTSERDVFGQNGWSSYGAERLQSVGKRWQNRIALKPPGYAKSVAMIARDCERKW